MLGPDDLIEAESIARHIIELADGDETRPLSVKTIAQRLTQRPIRRAPIRQEGSIARIDDRYELFLRHRLRPKREPWIIGHELGHWWWMSRDEHPENEEAWCDAIGAYLVAPRAAFANLRRRLGDRVHALAEHFRCEQALALLRIGEVTGRPVLLFRGPTALARGDAFEWSRAPRSLPRSVAHLIRVDDRWGMMAA